MRPIDRGPAPGGFTHYQDARDPLIQRIGDFCSYCENKLHSEVDVEHVQPKSLNPDAALSWSNFLLACGYCNSVKGNAPIVIGDHYWPDIDNTARVFKYELDLPPAVADGLPEAAQAKARRTLELTGLDRDPGHPRLSDRDRRWRKRREVWGIAWRSLHNLQANDTVHMRGSIVMLALSSGFWSVWMTVFQHDDDMRQRFITAFPGTALNCFAANGQPVPRPGSAI